MEWLDKIVSYWHAGGPLLLPIAGVCFGIWVYFLRTRERLSCVQREAEFLAAAWESQSPGRSAPELLSHLSPFEGPVAGMLRQVVREVVPGEDPGPLFLRRETECLRGLQRDFLVLSALIASAPLLGLLGTVLGMMETFEAVSMRSASPGKQVASGISRALITTQFGLAVALPGAFGLVQLERMLRHIQVLLASCRIPMVQALSVAEGKGAAHETCSLQ